ncbi:MAG TPA: carboxypeptidase-like regulatory domain-containing protein, partial [Bacteroidales bacterium]|nr:carboxypeptidase-like regulatory domain-containing protein [Bacteroidales bacterium]
MRKILFMCLTAAMLVMLFQPAAAQTKTVTGFVIDVSTNEGLAGVNVVAKGTSIGAITRADGSFTLNNVSQGQVLVFTFIGYLAKEITVGEANRLEVNLSPDILSVGEVVVTALGIKEERKNLGTAVTEVKGNDVIQTQRINFVDALQGRVAGMTINQSSGLPGASSQVVIRGISSLSQSNEPLYIV